MPQQLKCQICDYIEPIPMHCKQPMHIENIDDEVKLVCWMGPSCGVQDIPTHHDKSMQIIQDDEISELNQAEKIPEEQRVVIVMKQYQELKFTEIADILDEPINTVKSRLYYGLRAMKKVLETSRLSKEVLLNEM